MRLSPDQINRINRIADFDENTVLYRVFGGATGLFISADQHPLFALISAGVMFQGVFSPFTSDALHKFANQQAELIAQEQQWLRLINSTE